MTSITVEKVRVVLSKMGLTFSAKKMLIPTGGSFIVRIIYHQTIPICAFWYENGGYSFSRVLNSDCRSNVIHRIKDDMGEFEAYVSKNFYHQKKCRICNHKHTSLYCKVCLQRHDSLEPVRKMSLSDIERELEWRKWNTPAIPHERITKRKKDLEETLRETQRDSGSS